MNKMNKVHKKNDVAEEASPITETPVESVEKVATPVDNEPKVVVDNRLQKDTGRGIVQ